MRYLLARMARASLYLFPIHQLLIHKSSPVQKDFVVLQQWLLQAVSCGTSLTASFSSVTRILAKTLLNPAFLSSLATSSTFSVQSLLTLTMKSWSIIYLKCIILVKRQSVNQNFLAESDYADQSLNVFVT